MVHARDDYNRIQDPAVNDPSLLSDGSTPIGEDEPVFLLRAKDMSAPIALRFWAVIHQINGGDPKISNMVLRHADRMNKWQAEHGSKLADV